MTQQIPLWSPSPERRLASRMQAFVDSVERLHGCTLNNYQELHRWSVTKPDAFWKHIWQFCDIVGEDPGATILQRAERFQDSHWFPEARLNFAENLLKRRDNGVAIIALDEIGGRTELSWHQLYEKAGRFAAALKRHGIAPGDRIAGYMPNRIETVIAALGASWIGAVWSSCSPDFGVSAVLDRFGQIQPRILIAADHYHYNGKLIDLAPRISEIADQLQVECLVCVAQTPVATAVPSVTMEDWLDNTDRIPEFVRLPFDHPLYILYSSGTTGVPKCIVHGAGGTLLQHAKELQLHSDLGSDDRLFYFTTCGWMMWNWLVSGLQAGASIVLYDGNPAWPDTARLFDLIDAEQISHFGTSAKFIQAVEKSGLKPVQQHSLKTLQVLFSTGSPLLHESYDYIYRDVKADLQVASISGGTDIVSCFALGNPLLPVFRGELQCFGLAMDVAVYNDAGVSVDNEKGELVCRTPFPSMPIGFWNDSDGSKYQRAYFSRFDNVWAHGDYAETRLHEGHTGLIIHGRSDAVLNPGGVRIGTAEIYRQVEALAEIRESIVVGQEWQGDVRVVLFVVLQPEHQMSEQLQAKIRRAIRDGASPRHVPAKILQVKAIPRTVSGKIVELAVREVIHNRPVTNQGALTNPEALEYFRDRPELNQ
ncbi:MAG: acetoacetate--CoA ligase [Alcanivoracaceae bacterium]|nr:acetoacetate--CoA ligase [Alcanivoracaceae bacterium]